MDNRHSLFGLSDNKLVEITAVRVGTNTFHCGQTIGLLQVSMLTRDWEQHPISIFISQSAALLSVSEAVPRRDIPHSPFGLRDNPELDSTVVRNGFYTSHWFRYLGFIRGI
jgi:hypothetical protein